VGEADEGVLRRVFGEVMPEVGAAQPFVAVIVDGDAVAVCRTVRRSKRGVEAGLESALEYRGRGFGTLAAALWAVETRRVGGLPMYSLRWDNVASRRVAARLGLVQYGVDFHWSAA
jgi:RimJ/RimL family protein N-acetyltransferase